MLAAVHGRDQHQQRPSRYDEPQRARGLVALVIFRHRISTSYTTRSTPSLTSQHFLYIVQDEIHQLVVSFQRSHHYADPVPLAPRTIEHSFAQSSTRGARTFPTAVEFHRDLFVHVLGQIEDVLLLRLLRLLSAPTSSAAAAGTAMLSPARGTAATTEISAFGHVA